MKIAYLCPDSGVPLDGHKGASAHVRGLVRAWVALGHEVRVFTPCAGGEPDIGAAVVPIRVPEIADALAETAPPRLARALRHLWTNAGVEAAMRTCLRSYAPDLVYERYSPFGAAGGALARRMGLRHVLEVNAPLAWEGTHYRQQALPEAAEALERAALDATSLVIAVSEALRATLVAAGVAASKIAVVPNGVDADLFRPEGDAYRDGLDGRLVIGFVGSLKPWHGVELLADAFRRLAHDPRHHLLVVGDGPQGSVIDELAREWPGRVTRIGPILHREVPRYVRAMHVAVAPAPAREPYYFSPLKVLEYMAAGRAVVAAAIGQLRELVRAGETGLLVPPGDADALADAVRALAEDEARRRALGAAAAAEVRRRHLWTQRATEILRLAGVAA